VDIKHVQQLAILKIIQKATIAVLNYLDSAHISSNFAQ